MKKRVRIKDVAEKAGVSTGTVDRVLHERGNVNPAVKKKVLQVMEELGFERNMIASALARNKTFRFGVLLPQPESDPYWSYPYAGVQKADKVVKHYGVDIEMHHFELLNPDSFFAVAQEMMKKAPDAILFPPLFLQEGIWLLEECEKRQIPNAMINTNIEHPHSLCYIGQDSYQSGVLAARLLSIGLKKEDTLLILNLTKGSTNAKHLTQKVAGFKDYYHNSDQPAIKILVKEFEAFADPQKLKAFLDQIRQAHPTLSGIFFTNSRAHFAVDCLDDDFLDQVNIAGFDLIEENIKHLHDNKIDFIINQNPFEQGYLGIMNLYRHLVLKKDVLRNQHLPLDIVVKENIRYYLEREQHVHVL